MALRRTRHRMLAAGALLVTLGVTGCTDGGNATPTPTGSPVTTSASPTPSATPTPTPVAAPERPAAMATPSAEGAAAAASYFISLYPYARATGDVAEWQALSGAECAFCASVTDEVETLVGQGRSIAGGTISIESATGTEILAAESYSAEMVFSEAPTEKWKDGLLLSTGDGGRYSALVVLRWTGQAWQIRAVDLSPAP